MAKIEFPKIIIDYDEEIGDTIAIFRGKKKWNIRFKHTEDKLVAMVCGQQAVDAVDITDIAKDPMVIQLTIARVISSIIYADYTDDMKASIISGPKKAHLTRKTFDVDIIQPINDSSGNIVNPRWYCHLSRNGRVVMTISRNQASPNKMTITTPEIDVPVVIKAGVLCVPSYLSTDPDISIDMSITPTTEQSDSEQEAVTDVNS